MKIKDIILTSALLLGRDEIKQYIESQGQTNLMGAQEKVNAMVKLANLVINELCSSYVPMVKEDKVYVSTGKIVYKNLKETALKIVTISDAGGRKLQFENHFTYCAVPNGSVTVKYHYLPKEYALNDVIGYAEKDISLRALAFGLNAEFCITEGQFEQAVMWHQRYMQAVAEVCAPKNATVKQRSWQ